MMNAQEDYLFYQQISEHNILPLTGHCNFHCLFCSHGNNPKGIGRRGPHRKTDQIIGALELLDSKKPVVIGESASILSEGEPFLHPDWAKILAALRQRFPHTQIRITSNGSFLTQETVAFLATLAPIYINLSLNTIQHRERLLGDRHPEIAANAPHLLSAYGIPFQGSIVLTPQICGWDDIAATMKALGKGEMIRLLLPGFSRLAHQELFYDWEVLQSEAGALIEKLALPLPILLEPPLYQHNRPEISGVVIGSPGDLAGVKNGDRILSINGTVPANRHHAWQELCRSAKAEIRLQRGEEIRSCSFTKTKGNAGGVIFENDLDLQRLEEALQIKNRRQGTTVLCHSVFGTPYLNANLPLYPDLADVRLVETKSRFFGGNIQAAGLLTIADYRAALEEKNLFEIDTLLLPREGFTNGIYDLTGASICQLEQEIQGKIHLI